jgi:hypothetical protein
MGFFNEIRKVLFGAKAVTRSATRKAADAGRETGEDLKEKAGQYREKAEDLWEETSEQVSKKTDDFVDMAKDKWAQLEEELRQRRRESESPVEETAPPEEKDLFAGLDLEEDAGKAEGEEVPSFEEKKRREEAYREFKEKADEVANRFIDVSEQAGKKFMDLSERIGEQLFKHGGKALDKANMFAGELIDRANELADKAERDKKTDLDVMQEKAEELNKEMEERIRATRDRFAGKESDDADSLLDDKDDFFARADRFAKGDYYNKDAKKEEADKEDELELGDIPEYKPKKKEGTVPGFEDLDGDGDEIIDDAIIDEEE